MDETIVQPYSTQWIYITFRLQLLLAHPNIQLSSLKKRQPFFPSTYENYLKIEAAIDATDMDQPAVQSIKNSLKKDISLKSGRIIQNVVHSGKDIDKKHRILFFKMAVFQILPAIKQPTLSTEDFLVHYPQYDSIYSASRQPQLSIFNHQYLVKDPKQYQWEYDAQYIYSDFDQWNSDNIICQNCKLTSAKFYCLEDRESYCWPCFGDLHRSQKKSKHKRQPLTPYNCPPKCLKSLHQSDNLTHYCFNCKQLKCSICLQDGQHKKKSNPSSSDPDHQTIESRELAILFKQKQQQRLSELKVRITAQIRQIQAKIQLISGHYDLRLKEFARWFEEKAMAVKQWAIRELNLATGLHSQLKRKYDEVLWLENYSQQLDERCKAQQGMQIKQGISMYITNSFPIDYFQKIDKRVSDLKIFNT